MIVLAVSACTNDVEVRKAALLTSGNDYLKAGKHAEAIIEYRNAVQLDERFGAARLKLAEAYALAGNRARAAAEYIRASDLLPENNEVQLTAGEYLLLANRLDEAKQKAVVVLEDDPRNIRAQVLLGNALAGISELLSLRAGSTRTQRPRLRRLWKSLPIQ
jgi:tetratricopeptide (TPR) repeat protein